MRPAPEQAVSDVHPEDPDWRADALAQSRHSRLIDHLREPDDDLDPAKATLVCGEICRNVLGDFAPALLLLPAAERRRTQILAAFALTLHDFATQRGLEGDRLAEINRWEFRCDEALEGSPAGQPVFHLLAREHERRPWPSAAMDRLFALARRRATGRGNTADRKTLTRALAHALTGEEPSPDLISLGSALLGTGSRVESDAAQQVALFLGKKPDGVPKPWRAALTFARLAGARMLRINQRSSTTGAPRLGLLARVGLLIRARFSG